MSDSPDQTPQDTTALPGRSRRQAAEDLLRRADTLREDIGGDKFRDELVAKLFQRAEDVAAQVVRQRKRRSWLSGVDVDRVLTHPVFGIPVMAVLFALVFWITIVGANIPSAFLAGLLRAYVSNAPSVRQRGR